MTPSPQREEIMTLTGPLQTRAALFLAVGMAATVGGALAFQYIGGYLPCELCLKERIPYYVGTPIMVVALLAAARRWPALFTRGLLTVGGLLMTVGLAMAVYHSGVEWKFWPGPTDCAAASVSVTKNAGDLLNQLNAIHPPACDTAAGRFLGLSFAGWNAVASLIFAAVAYYAAFKSPKA